ncbi:uncharacterized protein LOC126281166 [Schistocerca gregaria]|uniref:uncharacterized protein LOC126281166 n=1 Tax=Schistocerca gregaria TaxID=7010 RepID=UPI00211E26CF|nr:uncharacterized protein LOC126281166 [Schistocerca gregaria]XP_049835797.1 uncharacterized protein LOC126281166 [Schistocerca gregaria]XP_049835798.1 uncharacterized protein LOC126281166 [Schistocerca gregaria]XP_049835799.1 uncharacterized protein LOC126281166 [Schistocerca gregaria]
MELTKTFPDQDKLTAEQCANIYCDLVDHHREHLVRHLSDDVVLDWFGRTIAGKEMLLNFFQQETHMEHKLVSVEPAGYVKIQRRPAIRKLRKQCVPDLKETIFTDECSKVEDKFPESEPKLPFYHTGKKFPRIPVQVCKETYRSALPLSRYERGQGDEENYFLEASGTIEFAITKQSPTSPKNLKLIADSSKWERNFKLHLSCILPKNEGLDPVRNLEIFQIIYSSTSRCRKNLFQAFSQA